MKGLSKPSTKAGRLQRECLALLREHEADGALPTSIRFLFYELEERRIIPKAYRHADGTLKPRQPGQDISDAVGVLREAALIPWDWIVDETRSLDDWRFADSVYSYVKEVLPVARIDLWAGEPPPLILCESRSLAGVLRNIAGGYLCPIAATNGQAGGFLHTKVAPLISATGEAGRRVLYLGDLDLSGGHIEANTRGVLGSYGPLEWSRVAITHEQVREHGFQARSKADRRYADEAIHSAVETEKLGQSTIMALLTRRLDDLLPEPRAEVLEREEAQRVRVRERLNGGE